MLPEIAPHRIPTTFRTASQRFDRAKWDALLKYDPQIATVAEKLKPLGGKWVDEFAASYLALNDKAYLPEMVRKIIMDARAEQERRDREKEEREKALELQIKQEQQKRALDEQKRREREQAVRQKIDHWRNRFWGTPRNRLQTAIVIVSMFAIGLSAIYLYEARKAAETKLARIAELQRRHEIEENARRFAEEQRREQEAQTEAANRIARRVLESRNSSKIVWEYTSPNARGYKIIISDTDIQFGDSKALDILYHIPPPPLKKYWFGEIYGVQTQNDYVGLLVKQDSFGTATKAYELVAVGDQGQKVKSILEKAIADWRGRFPDVPTGELWP